MNADIAVAQEEILSRLAQVEKTVQGHASQMADWQSEEEHGGVPHAGVSQQALQSVQCATGQQGE